VRRGLFLLLTWLAGTVVAIGLAWGAVSVVRHNVTERRVAPLSARAVSEALDSSAPDTSTTVVVDETTTTTLGPDPVTTVTTTSSGGRTTTTRKGSSGSSSTPTTRPTTGGTTGTGTNNSGGTSTNPTGGGTNAGGSSSSPTTTTSTPGSQYTGERVVDDGNRNQVDVRCQGQTVSYGWITPASGWSYQVLQNGPADLIVKFTRESPHTESRLEASCDAAGHPTFTWKH